MTKQRWVAAVLVLGAAARMLAATRGHNFDVESYRIVGEIVDRGGSVYNETERYNYGPVWFTVIGILYKATIGAGLGFLWFRYAVAAVLTVVDVAMALLLRKRFGDRAAALFFLNPVSILITGYHSQFDNLAVLIALAGAVLLLDGETRAGVSRRDWAGLVLLGLSLATKHILVLLPLWLAMRKPDVRSRLIVLAVPPAVFGLLLAPFWLSASEGIMAHVVRYRSYNNTPFLQFILDRPVSFTAATALLMAVLVVAGVLLRDRVPLDESLLVYLLITVALAPAIANQYLAICIPAVAVFANAFFVVYTAHATVYLLGDYDGLRYAWVPDAFDRNGAYPPYQYLAMLLVAGTAWFLGRRLSGRPARSALAG